MYSWKRLVRNYFTFNTRERRGITALLILLSVVSAIHLWVRSVPPNPASLSDEDELKRIAAMITSAHDEQPDLKQIELDASPYVFTHFDPNTVSAEVLLATGLNPKLADRIVHYREKGGRFSSAADLGKIYGMDTVWLAQAKAYLEFPARVYQKPDDYMSVRPYDKTSTVPTEIRRIEINTADSAALVQIPGIGPFYAREILKRRNRLGGFESYDQLLEIQKIREEVVEALLLHTTLDSTALKQININNARTEELAIHPYISLRQARTLVNYRTHHGAYKSVGDIMATEVISDSLYRKIAPYLRAD